ncbi:hypothetical protein [Streptomyces sp. A0592]|uniref:hypothetical protein n=1 Tax=Streptomyces sp. A0592 TaxID=2563099 RepID=UPI00109E8E3D|nr:hypothetical protein [Streptomyces sp. A0592]THA85495.1 hypothetical protein E6U81_05430 [Streptomyces sp. A0592]
MQWTALISTVVGGGIATLSAVVLEYWRWKRQRVDHRTEAKRVLCGAYLAAVAKARHECGAQVRETERPAAHRSKAVWDAIEPCISLRFEIGITAPSRVAAAESGEYTRTRTAYKQAHQALRDAMKDDLMKNEP